MIYLWAQLISYVSDQFSDYNSNKMKFAIAAALVAILAQAQDRVTYFNRVQKLEESHCRVEPAEGGLDFLGGPDSGAWGGIHFWRESFSGSLSSPAPVYASTRWWGLQDQHSYKIGLRGASDSIGETMVADFNGYADQQVTEAPGIRIPEDVGKEACLFLSDGMTLACCTIQSGEGPDLAEMARLGDAPVLTENQFAFGGWGF